MRKLKRLLTLSVFVLMSMYALAQEQTITGIIRDAADNAPLPGVSIRIKGSRTGTTTSATGAFSIIAKKIKFKFFFGPPT